MALQQLTNIVHRESVVMAFSDVLLLLTALSIGLSVLAIFIKRPVAPSAGGGSH